MFMTSEILCYRRVLLTKAHLSLIKKKSRHNSTTKFWTVNVKWYNRVVVTRQLQLRTIYYILRKIIPLPTTFECLLYSYSRIQHRQAKLISQRGSRSWIRRSMMGTEMWRTTRSKTRMGASLSSRDLRVALVVHTNRTKARTTTIN